MTKLVLHAVKIQGTTSKVKTVLKCLSDNKGLKYFNKRLNQIWTFPEWIQASEQNLKFSEVFLYEGVLYFTTNGGNPAIIFKELENRFTKIKFVITSTDKAEGEIFESFPEIIQYAFSTRSTQVTQPTY